VFRVVAEPTPGPTPGPTQPPSPGDDGGSHEPEPTPSPSPGPKPKPPAPWGEGPDIGVTPSWLRQRAAACDDTAEAVRRLTGAADDTFAPLSWAAPGWKFAESVDDMQHRWDDLAMLLQQRLHQASENFRLSADSYTETDTAAAESLGGGLG